ncbi:hypothetical protein AB1Y20_008340 [Prymnesium parvum]|uniref:Intraflagellar transport protein 74 homolog n=1 Tax=Prymnesium parvum TaxID=97485 RepID=A0AB34IUB6_PRYPA
MDRPSSRGGGVARPSSRGNPMAGAPPSTAALRLGTAGRPSTGTRAALGSRRGSGAVNMSGVGLTTSMNISERPVTQQGLSGIRTAGMGPSRQIQDNSYYLTILRAKNAEIMQEIETLKGQIEQGKKDNQAYGQLERKYESLTNDMRTLQGELADYNLLLDRTRAHREVDDVAAEAHALQNNNASDRHRVDEVFNHRSNLESQARDVEHQLARHHQALAQRLDEVDPAMKEHFIKLQTRQQILASQELPKRQADIHFFDEKMREMEVAVTRDPMRAKAARLRDEVNRLERKQQMLSEELDGPQLSESQQREMLLQKVKADNLDIAEAERVVAEHQEAIRRGRAQLSQLSNEMSEANDPKTQRFQELFAKDKEMSELIDTFDEKKAIEVKKLEATQEKVVGLLQAISRKMAQSENTGGMSEDKFNEMRSDLDFKQMQMDNSVSTSAKLEGELQRRKVELEKINTLDEKISLELQQLNEKMATMTSELATFKDLVSLKDNSAHRADELVRAKNAAEQQMGQAKAEEQQLKAEYEGIKAALAKDEVAIAIDELEQKMRHHEQTVYMLSEYIDTKGAETMFEPIAEECHATMAQINAETIRVLSEQSVFTASAY